MSGSTIRTSATKLDALQLQSSARGVTVPYVRGVARVACNLAWYNGFKATPHTKSQGGKGGVGGSESRTYTYSASAILLVCRGPVIDFPRIWVGKEVFTGGVTPAQVLTTSEAYAVPASGAMTYTVSQAANLLVLLGVSQGTTLLCEGRHYSFGTAGLLTVLDDALRGSTLTVRYQYRGSTINRTALAKLGLSFLVGHIGQATWSGLSGFPAESIAYSGHAGVAGQDYPLGESAQLDNHLFEVVGPLAYHLGSSVPDVDPALFLRELLVDDRDGAGFPSEYLGDWTRWSDYCVAANLLVSPALTEQSTAADVIEQAAKLTNAAISTSGGKLQMIPRADSPESGNGRTYTPALTPVYDLDDEFYTPSSSGGSPVRYRLKSNAERYNTWSVEYRNRANSYATDTADAKDSADIAERGVRANPDTVRAHWICNAAAAGKAVQLMMQRSVSVLADYEVPLPPHYSLIDLADLLTLKDTGLGLDRAPVFVTGIDEDDEGNLTILCEDYPIGSASAALYASPEGQGYLPDYSAAPGNVDVPVMIEAPAQLAGTTGIEVYIGVRGSGADWGGCQVWTSLDGSNYKQVATLYGPSRYGALNGAITNVATSMAVDGLGAEQLTSGSATDAAQLATLCFLGGTQGEFVAHQAATLTGTGAYTLAGLVRGAYGSPAVAHADNVVFARLDDRMARSGPLAPSMVGQTLYVKCLSFNRYQAALQSLAEATEHTYVITGQPASYNPGIAGKALDLRASSLTFQYPKAGGVNPASVTLTAERKGGLLGAVTWSVVAGTATLTGSGDTRSLAAGGLATDAATIRATITDGVASYVDEVTIVKVREGADGAVGPQGPQGLPGADGTDGSSAPLLVLLADRQAFTFNGAGAAAPTSQTITFTAALQNITGTATFAATLFNSAGSSIGTVTLGGSGNTRTMTVAQFASAAYARVTATLSSLSDVVTVIRLQDGVDGSSPVASDLSNDAHTLPANYDGAVTSYAGAQTQISIYVGLVDDTANWTITRANSTGVTSTLAGSLLTVTAMTTAVNSGYVDITATRAGYPTQVKRFTLSKSKGGPGTEDGPVATLTLNAAAYVASGTSTATITFKTNGTITRTENGVTTAAGNWYKPTTTGIGSSHWLRATLKANNTTPSGTFSSWVALSSDRAYSVSRSSTGSNFADMAIGIATDSGGADIPGNHTVTLIAEHST